jgi:hypothetical protein
MGARSTRAAARARDSRRRVWRRRWSAGTIRVLVALNDARVAHLVYDPEVRFHGAVGEDGRLSAPPEQRLMAERIVDELRLAGRRLETEARITPVGSPAVRLLADGGGVATMPRW